MTGTARDLFLTIVEELTKSGVIARRCDATVIEMLAYQLEAVRQPRKRPRAKTTSVLDKETMALSWELAIDLAKDLKLPEAALKRIGWVQ